jgi:hypothetical protein
MVTEVLCALEETPEAVFLNVSGVWTLEAFGCGAVCIKDPEQAYKNQM